MFRITEDPSSGSLIQCLANFTRMVQLCSLTWTQLKHCCKFLAKHCTSLPDDGSSVIRNMLEHFKYFVFLNWLYELYIVH